MRKPTTIADTLIRILTTVTVLLLGAAAAVVSYTHVLELALANGQAGLTAHLTPLTVDGLVLVPSLVALDRARRNEGAPLLAHFALGLGIVATLAANVVYGLEYGWLGAAIAGWPAVALVLSHHLLMGMIRSGRPVEVDGMDEHVAAALDLAAAGLGRRLVPAAVSVERPVVAALEAPGEALAVQDSGRPDEDVRAGGEPVVDLASAIVSAKAAGRSIRAIADEFGVTKYRVGKVLEGAGV